MSYNRSRWKEECNTITQKMDVKLTESQGELKNERRRTEELTRLLRDCRNKTVEVKHFLILRRLHVNLKYIVKRIYSNPFGEGHLFIDIHVGKDTNVLISV